MLSPLRTLAHLLGIATLATALGACAAETGTDENTDQASEELSANQSTAYHFFVNKGLKDFQAAAIVGNLMQESSVNPASVQPGGPGRGIAQWSVGGRWNVSSHDNVHWYAGTKGASTGSLSLQLDFIWYELENFPQYGLSRLKNASNISSAVVAFQTDFEICGACNQSRRISDAKQVLSSFGGSSGSSGGSSGSSGASSGGGCYSSTLGKEVAPNACVQSKSNKAWYECKNGSWVDRFSDPTACNGTYPL
jgi:uncharacterized membrane protein YgcG